MKVICAPDSFKGSISAVAAAEAMARGVRRVDAGIEVDCCPVADGGEGLLEVIAASIPGEMHERRVLGPLGTPVEAVFGLFDDGRAAVVESAQATGLTLVPEQRRNIMRAMTFGLGELLLAAAEMQPQRLIVGIGGSASNDCGCGMAQALGVRFRDRDGEEILEPLSGGSLSNVVSVDIEDRAPWLDRIAVTAACDVDNPLTGPRGAAFVYAPQKGATEEDVVRLDGGLAHIAAVIRRDLKTDIETLPGAGAAGGLGGGLVAFAGASIASGIGLVLDMIGFRKRAAGCDLCLTGEGRLDGQSLSGKACIGVARAATDVGVATVALVGATGPDADRTLDAGLEDYVEIGEGLPDGESMTRVAALLEDAAESVVRRYL